MSVAASARRGKSSSRISVVAALIGDLFVAASKFVAALWTGSAAMTSEAIHSVVDTTNEILLLYGIHRSNRKPMPTSHSGMDVKSTFGASSFRC